MCGILDDEHRVNSGEHVESQPPQHCRVGPGQGWTGQAITVGHWSQYLLPLMYCETTAPWDESWY